MTTKPSYKPWHKVVQLRDDLKTGELSLAVFVADLYDVIMQKGQRPVYEHPAEFFALTYPTYNLRELVKDVALRLAGKSDKAYRKLSVNYGGGKTHTLITLRHLVHDPATLPDLPAVKEFEASIGSKAPKARVAALCFDKIDLEKGVETPAKSRRHDQNAQASVEHPRLSTGGSRRPQTHPRRRQRRRARHPSGGTARGRAAVETATRRSLDPGAA